MAGRDTVIASVRAQGFELGGAGGVGQPGLRGIERVGVEPSNLVATSHAESPSERMDTLVGVFARRS